MIKLSTLRYCWEMEHCGCKTTIAQTQG